MRYSLQVVLTWGPLRVGDCQQSEGKLLCTPDGTAYYSCINSPRHTSFGDVFQVGIEVRDRVGGVLFDIPTQNGSTMEDSWSFFSKFDPSFYQSIYQAWLRYSC